MANLDLNERFLRALNEKIPNKAALIREISRILNIEKDSAYRRQSNKVNLSTREMGLLADELHISIDNLIREVDRDTLWIPIKLERPLGVRSMNEVVGLVSRIIHAVEETNKDGYGESGNVYNTIPMEFYAWSPIMTKFMFFKWGHYFISSEEFNNFSRWTLPHELENLSEKYHHLFNYKKLFYVWDNSLVWNLASEIDNFARMEVITMREKSEIMESLRDILDKIEQTLNGTYQPTFTIPKDFEFYVSPVNLGFIGTYSTSNEKSIAMLQTNFSFTMVENVEADFHKIRQWIDDFRLISTLLSKSGHKERRMFFNQQHKIIRYYSE